MKRTVRYLCLFLGVIMMLTLFGCGKKKYTLRFDGYGFESKKTAYAAGDRVTVYYGPVATDTDYRFRIDDDVELSEEYDDERGYALIFTMPDHDVTLHVQSRNSMVVPEPDTIRVTLINRVDDADFWILPQTEENLKTSLWGTATAKDLRADETREITLAEAEDAYIVRVIDDESAYYSAKDVRLGDGYSIRFTTGDSRYDAVIEILDADGSVLDTQTAFVGMLGAQ